MTNIRMSRITHPRGTLSATLLLIVVLLGLGVAAQAAIPAQHCVSAEQTETSVSQ